MVDAVIDWQGRVRNRYYDSGKTFSAEVKTLVAESRSFNPELKRDKLEQAILFFLHQAPTMHLERAKLMKLLYFADFDHFERHNESITGSRYFKLPYGPEPIEVEDIVSDMAAMGRIRCFFVRDFRGHTQDRCEPIEALNPFDFTGTERETLDLVATRWRDANVQDISAASHDEAPWQAVKFDELIPYSLAYYRNTYGELEMDDEFLESGTLAAIEE